MGLKYRKDESAKNRIMYLILISSAAVRRLYGVSLTVRLSYYDTNHDEMLFSSQKGVEMPVGTSVFS